MKVDLAFSPNDLTGEKTFGGALVIDILRATSVMVTLLAGGAPKVLLAKDVVQAKSLKEELGEGWYTSGARFGKKVDGFDYANAMIEFDKADLSERKFILSTTNGTGTIYLTWNFINTVLVGALLNATATAKGILDILEESGQDFLVILSGVRGKYTLDDALTAGVILDRLAKMSPHCTFGDEARTCLLMARGVQDLREELRRSRTGQCLAEVGLIEEVDFTLQVDKYDMTVQVAEEDGLEGTLGLKPLVL